MDSDEYVPSTNYDFVNQIMRKLQSNSADELLHSARQPLSNKVPQELLFASAISEKSSRRSTTSSYPVFSLVKPRASSSKYLSLKDRFAPLINRFGKQKRALAVMNKIQNLVRNFSNITTYSFKSIEKKYPEIAQFNDYYEHQFQNQNYDEKEMQQILINLEKLLLKDKVNHELHNTVLNNEFNSTNEELLEAIQSFNILNAS